MGETSASDEADRVVDIIKKAIEAVADHAEISRVESPGRTVPLLFPKGIGDIHVSLKVAGGVSIDIEISGPPEAPKEIKEVIEEKTIIARGAAKGSVHPMTIQRHRDGDSDAKDGKSLQKIYVAVGYDNDIATFGPIQELQPDEGKHDFTFCTAS
jgi:hypothetical protein